MLEGEQGGEVTISGSVLHEALGLWFRSDYGGAEDEVMVRSLPTLMILEYTERCLTLPLLCSKAWREGHRSLHPENPSRSPTGPAASFMVAQLVFPLGWRLGEHNHCQTHSALPIPFPNQLQTELWKALHPSREKPALLCH